MSGCLICGDDDGLTLLCREHWSEYVEWEREHEDENERLSRMAASANHQG